MEQAVTDSGNLDDKSVEPHDTSDIDFTISSIPKSSPRLSIQKWRKTNKHKSPNIHSISSQPIALDEIEETTTPVPPNTEAPCTGVDDGIKHHHPCMAKPQGGTGTMGKSYMIRKNVKMSVKKWDPVVVARGPGCGGVDDEEDADDADVDGDSGFLTDLFSRPSDLPPVKGKLISPHNKTKTCLFEGTSDDFFG